MCGIVAAILSKKLTSKKIKGLLKLMKSRGPDHQSYIRMIFGKKIIYLFHSRLSIIDLKIASNQPFQKKNCLIIFNGEIYNYLEIKKNLEKKGVKFQTNSDTEVLLEAYLYWGKDAVYKLEGMWSFVIYDILRENVIISRDLQNEKPLFFEKNKNNNNLIYGSEIRFINYLNPKKQIDINAPKLLTNLVKGYKCWFESKETIYNKIQNFNSFNLLEITKIKEINKKILFKNFTTKVKKEKKSSYKNIKKELREIVIDTVQKTLRSDVPLAYSLSGGIDSSLIVSISRKILNNKVKTYSIIDKDPRYDESELIKKTSNKLKLNSKFVKINNQDHFQRLVDLTNYYKHPVPTINFLLQSYLAKELKKDGVKILLSGNGADELFSGYYHHYINYFQNNENLDNKNLDLWEKKVKPHIRNNNFKDLNCIIDKKNLLSNYNYFLNTLGKKKILRISDEKKFTNSKFKNRLLNEMYAETIPVITFAEDLNCMKESIENRNPFLNISLINFVSKIPENYFIQNGFTKFLLRDTFSDILPQEISENYKKNGFNFSFRTLFPLDDNRIIKFIEKRSPIYNYVNKKKILELYNKNFLNDEENKFAFSFLTTKIFLEQLN